jgi:hypothetical protein
VALSSRVVAVRLNFCWGFIVKRRPLYSIVLIGFIQPWLVMAVAGMESTSNN